MRHHLVVVRQNYLNLLLSGKKHIECRLSAVCRPPFESVSRGDVLWLKLPSREIMGVARVAECRFRSLESGSDLIAWVRRFGNGIHAEAAFYRDAVAWARYATLVWVESVVRISPMCVTKSDQRAWVVMPGPPRPGMRIAAVGRRTGR